MCCRLVTIWIQIRNRLQFPIVYFHLNGEIKHIMHVPMMILAQRSTKRLSFNHGAQRKSMRTTTTSMAQTGDFATKTIINAQWKCPGRACRLKGPQI